MGTSGDKNAGIRRSPMSPGDFEVSKEKGAQFNVNGALFRSRMDTTLKLQG
jgi:hypothetical protein